MDSSRSRFCLLFCIPVSHSLFKILYFVFLLANKFDLIWNRATELTLWVLSTCQLSSTFSAKRTRKVHAVVLTCSHSDGENWHCRVRQSTYWHKIFKLPNYKKYCSDSNQVLCSVKDHHWNILCRWFANALCGLSQNVLHKSKMAHDRHFENRKIAICFVIITEQLFRFFAVFHYSSVALTRGWKLANFYH